MMYLVRTEKSIKECRSWSEVKLALLKACAAWVTDENYVATKDLDTPQKLFDLAMNEKDFGEVAQVFRLTAKDDDNEDSLYFDCCSPQDTFICERIL